MNFEKLLKELQEIVTELESGKLSLEQSIEKYQRGMDLSNQCRKILEDAKKVIITKMDDK